MTGRRLQGFVKVIYLEDPFPVTSTSPGEAPALPSISLPADQAGLLLCEREPLPGDCVSPVGPDEEAWSSGSLETHEEDILLPPVVHYLEPAEQRTWKDMDYGP